MPKDIDLEIEAKAEPIGDHSTQFELNITNASERYDYDGVVELFIDDRLYRKVNLDDPSPEGPTPALRKMDEEDLEPGDTVSLSYEVDSRDFSWRLAANYQPYAATGVVKDGRIGGVKTRKKGKTEAADEFDTQQTEPTAEPAESDESKPSSDEDVSGEGGSEEPDEVVRTTESNDSADPAIVRLAWVLARIFSR